MAVDAALSGPVLSCRVPSARHDWCGQRLGKFLTPSIGHLSARSDCGLRSNSNGERKASNGQPTGAEIAAWPDAVSPASMDTATAPGATADQPGPAGRSGSRQAALTRASDKLAATVRELFARPGAGCTRLAAQPDRDVIRPTRLHPNVKDHPVAESMVTPVAVIGMACRLPGGIDSPNSCGRRCSEATIWSPRFPADRWDTTSTTTRTRCAGPDGVAVGRIPRRCRAVSTPILRAQRREAIALDPQHRLLLEASWEAMEHAGLTPSSLAGSGPACSSADA